MARKGERKTRGPAAGESMRWRAVRGGPHCLARGRPPAIEEGVCTGVDEWVLRTRVHSSTHFRRQMESCGKRSTFFSFCFLVPALHTHTHTHTVCAWIERK